MNKEQPSPLLALFANQERTELQHEFAPTTLAQYIGQTALKEKLHVYTTAAAMRQEPLDHLLLFGPPGLGKTTLATLMAHTMQVQIKIITGPMLERTGDLVAILSSLQPRDILFIDEIHRMATAVEEVLYSAMEQFRVDIIIGQGAGAKTVNLPIAPFTLIGATTRSGMLSAPLRSRFGIIERLDYYTDQELQEIVLQSAQFLQVTVCPQGALAIARSARGTPRIAKKLLRRVRDFAQVAHGNHASVELVEQSLRFLGIDADGLTTLDNMLLKTIVCSFRGGPVGLETLAAIIGEDAETLETVYEPFLLRQGLLEKTARGRQVPAVMLDSLRCKYLGQQNIVTR